MKCVCRVAKSCEAGLVGGALRIARNGSEENP